MAAKIVHFGKDHCSRIRVLHSAGYVVEECGSLTLLRSALATSVDAIAVSGGPAESEQDAAGPVLVARANSSAPIILFEGVGGSYEYSQFDLVIPVLTSPHDWLTRIDLLIAKTRAVRKDSELLREKSRALRTESTELRNRTAAERERSRKLLPTKFRHS